MTFETAAEGNRIAVLRMSVEVNAVLDLVDGMEELYHRLLLLVAPSGAGKTGVLKAVCASRKAPCINVNLELSKSMLDLTSKQRALRAASLLGAIVEKAGGNLVGLDNLEVLFDRSLHLDPLRVLKDLSRQRGIVASWNGDFNDRGLTYGEPDHPEFRQYAADEIDFLYVTSEGNEG